MKKVLSIIMAVLFISCGSEQNNNTGAMKYGLVIHGGAGVIKRESMDKDTEQKYRDKLAEAMKAGFAVIDTGGAAMEAVEKTIKILEDSPLFNAGKGAVFTADGKNELDASVMDGKTLNAGAVGRVRHIKNPVSLAIKVMNNSPHVLMVGDGAEKFAREQGFEMTDTSYFFTEERWKSLQKARGNKVSDTKKVSSAGFDPDNKFGTVGCVALDKKGNIAAGTSTGGMTNKMYGRIGDSPIIGAGTYADNETCGVSGTGHGEYFIRGVLAYDISAKMKYEGKSLREAAELTVKGKLENMGGSGGVIALDKDGNIAMPFNTDGMFRGYITENGNPVTKIFADE